MNLEIEVTEDVPTHWVIALTDGDNVTVKVSPKVEATALSALREDIGDAVAVALDAERDAGRL